VKLQAKKADCLTFPVHLALSCLKMQNSPDDVLVTYRNCFYFCYVTMQIVLDFSIGSPG